MFTWANNSSNFFDMNWHFAFEEFEAGNASGESGDESGNTSAVKKLREAVVNIPSDEVQQGKS